MEPYLSVQAPTATTWQSLYNLYWILSVIAGAITIGALVFFSVRYRSKDGSHVVSHREDARKTTRNVLIVIILMAIALGSAAASSFSAIGTYENPPPSSNAIHVNVIASRFQWTFNYSGREIPGQLTVPQNTVVILNVTSIDVFHSFGIPSLRVKSDAIPGKTNTIWFSAAAGTYRMQCYELCGNGHAFMAARLTVCQSGC